MDAFISECDNLENIKSNAEWEPVVERPETNVQSVNMDPGSESEHDPLVNIRSSAEWVPAESERSETRGEDKVDERDVVQAPRTKKQKQESQAEKRKRARNSGLAYTNCKRSQVERKVFQNSDCGCRKNCFQKINEASRRHIFETFWKMGSFSVQNIFMCGLITQAAPKTRHAKNSTTSRPRKMSSNRYRFQVQERSIDVCKAYFLKTLQISDGRMTRAIKKFASNAQPGSDNRGRHTPANKISDERMNVVREHISTFPPKIRKPKQKISTISTHSASETPDRKFPIPNLNVRLMYNLYKEHCLTIDMTPVKEPIYRRTFNKEFNRTKKRQKQESKAEKRKIARNSGLAYTNSKSNQVERKVFQNPDCGCRKNCFQKIDETSRRHIFDTFWKMGSFSAQNVFMCGLITQEAPKTRHAKISTSRPRRMSSNRYRFQVQGRSVDVCKPYFLKTLQISDGRMTRAIKKFASDAQPGSDNRGRRIPGNKISDERLNVVREHISSFPSCQSQTSSEKQTRRFLPSNLNVRFMYNLYKEHCLIVNMSPVKEPIYRRTFNKEFNLHFHLPTNDDCSKCDVLKIHFQQLIMNRKRFN